MNIKRLYNQANNPIKRETELYIEAVKMTFVTAQDPTKRAAKQYNKKTTSNLTTTKITTTTTTTNNTIAITPNDTELDHNPEDYKSNHNK